MNDSKLLTFNDSFFKEENRLSIDLQILLYNHHWPKMRKMRAKHK